MDDRPRKLIRAFRNLSLSKLSPFLALKRFSMTEGSNFDFLFKVRLYATRRKSGNVTRNLLLCTGRFDW
jgi:hypothetical protein